MREGEGGRGVSKGGGGTNTVIKGRSGGNLKKYY